MHRSLGRTGAAISLLVESSIKRLHRIEERIGTQLVQCETVSEQTAVDLLSRVNVAHRKVLSGSATSVLQTAE